MAAAEAEKEAAANAAKVGGTVLFWGLGFRVLVLEGLHWGWTWFSQFSHGFIGIWTDSEGFSRLLDNLKP